MENAGLQVLETIRELIGELGKAKVIILAGKGNNGGDGLVLGRHLINAGARVDIFLLGESQNLSSDAYVNYSILEKMDANLIPLRADEDLDRLHDCLAIG